MAAERDAGTDRQAKTKPVEMFYSYAHEDEGLRQELVKYLTPLQREGYITSWHDRMIGPGSNWRNQIDEHLNSADIILLLISADFLASDYCYDIEMKRALQRSDAQEAKVIPILLRPCDWKSSPFGKLQVLPSDALPITRWNDRDEAFTAIAHSLREMIKGLPKDLHTMVRTLRVPPPDPYFTGRKEILDKLQNALSRRRTVALSGLGGIGKTQIAIEYAHQHHDEYRHIFWLHAGSGQELSPDYATIADVVGLAIAERRQDQKVDAARRWLEHNGDWLLIFDNANDTSLVQRYLPDNSKGHVILTTRTQFPGRFAHKIEIEKMPDDEGILFLLRRSSLLSEDASIEQIPRPECARALEIVRELDGLPLALEQAAIYIDQTSCGLRRYLQKYHKQPITLLKHNPPNSDYDKTVATTWTEDFQNVESANHSAANLLCLCTFLIPDAIPEEIVSDGSTELGPTLKPLSDPFQLDAAIQQLRKYSLIKRDTSRDILSIHQLVQLVQLDRLPARQRRKWAKLAIRAVNEVFPDGNYDTWLQCERLLLQAQNCDVHLKQYKLAFIEAADLLDKVATYLRKQGHYEQAERFYERALTITKQVWGHENLHTALASNNLAFIYYLQGHYEQAVSLYEKALGISEQVSGGDDPDTAAILNNLANLYSEQAQYEQAELYYKRALAVYEDFASDEPEQHEPEPHPDAPSIAEDNPDYVPAYPAGVDILKNQAKLYSDQGQYEQAELYYERALAVYEDFASDEPEQSETEAAPDTPVVRHSPSNDFPDNPAIATILHDRGKHYQRQGCFEDAERDYQQALDIQERVLGEHPETALTLSDIAGLYKQQGRYPEAEPFYQRAIAMHKKVFGPKHRTVAIDSEGYADLLRKMGRVDEAEEMEGQWARKRKK